MLSWHSDRQTSLWRNVWHNRAIVCANKCRTQGLCNSAKSECSALGFHFFLWMRRQVWNPPGVSEVVILVLGLEALNASSARQCGKGMPGRGSGTYTHRARAVRCVCRRYTVSEWSTNTHPSTAWDSPGMLGHQGVPNDPVSTSQPLFCSVDFWAEGGMRRRSSLQLESSFCIKRGERQLTVVLGKGILRKYFRRNC